MNVTFTAAILFLATIAVGSAKQPELPTAIVLHPDDVCHDVHPGDSVLYRFKVANVEERFFGLTAAMVFRTLTGSGDLRLAAEGFSDTQQSDVYNFTARFPKNVLPGVYRAVELHVILVPHGVFQNSGELMMTPPITAQLSRYCLNTIETTAPTMTPSTNGLRPPKITELQ